jgi:hypothetical protein
MANSSTIVAIITIVTTTYLVTTSIDVLYITFIHGKTVSELQKTAALVAVFRCQLTSFTCSTPQAVLAAHRTFYAATPVDSSCLYFRLTNVDPQEIEGCV